MSELRSLACACLDGEEEQWGWRVKGGRGIGGRGERGEGGGRRKALPFASNISLCLGSVCVLAGSRCCWAGDQQGGRRCCVLLWGVPGWACLEAGGEGVHVRGCGGV